MQEVYVSTDIEADGPIPGPHSMLSFASAAYLEDKTLVATFSANLDILPGACGHPATMRWWRAHQDAWWACRENLQSPTIAMPAYSKWLRSLPGRPIFVAYPLGFDFTFVYWYLIRFATENPFSRNGIDIRTYAMALLNRSYRGVSKGDLPREWFDDFPHTHRALDDAIEQGALFCNMLQFNRRRNCPGRNSPSDHG